MNILGMGVDVVEIKRIKKIIKKNNSFLNRIFTSKEVKYCSKNKKNINCFAKRFAAKEAFVKALGIGFRQNINFNDIDIINNRLGKPSIKLNNLLNKKVKLIFKIRKFNIFLSMSDENNYAFASVIITKKWRSIKNI